MLWQKQCSSINIFTFLRSYSLHLPYKSSNMIILFSNFNRFQFSNIQDTGGKKLPYQPSPVTSTNVRIIPKNFMTFIFNHFATLIYNFKAISSASPKILSLKQDNQDNNGLSGQILVKLRLSQSIKPIISCLLIRN